MHVIERTADEDADGPPGCRHEYLKYEAGSIKKIGFYSGLVMTVQFTISILRKH